MKKSLIATLLALASFSVCATDYFVVVPVPGKSAQVAGISVALSSGALPQALVGQPYTFSFAQHLRVTGDPNYTGPGVSWRVVAGTLPEGLSLNSGTGELTGTPSAASASDITVRATYKTKTGQQAYELVTVQLTVGLTAATIPPAKVNAAYTPYDFKQHLSVTGDPAFAASGASFRATGLPEGLSLSSTGVLAGTPKTKNAGAEFTVAASYKNSTGEQVYTLVVNGAALQVKQISGGNYHSCAVTTAGAAVCWGANWYGQLGNGATESSYTPVRVSGLSSGVASIHVAQTHTCALTTAGGVKCWGENGYGLIGDGGSANRLTPVDVPGLTSGVKSVATVLLHNCAVTTSGGVKCWGDNTRGQLGDGTTARYSHTPVDVSGVTNAIAVTVGEYHSCALTSGGGAKCWGVNADRELGDGTTTQRNVAVTVAGLAGATSIKAGGSHTCATVVVNGNQGRTCWGWNGRGQLGAGDTGTYTAPVTVMDGTRAIAVGAIHTCVVTSGGTARCWGDGTDGALGYGIKVNSAATNVDIPGLAGVKDIDAGPYISCAVMTSGDAKCWGDNYEGQLGDGTDVDRTTPTDVSALN